MEEHKQLIIHEDTLTSHKISIDDKRKYQACDKSSSWFNRISKSSKKMTAAVECAGCYRPIRDRFLLKVLDKDWHSSCVRCQMCRKLLDEKCFYKEGKMYCKDDFYRWENIFVLIFINLTIKYEVRLYHFLSSKRKNTMNNNSNCHLWKL